MSDDYAEQTLSQAGPGALCAELQQHLDAAGQDGDGGELAAHVLDELNQYFSTEALLSVLADRAGGPDASIPVKAVSTRDLCSEVQRRIVSTHSYDPVAGDTASEILAEHVTLSDAQIKDKFKEAKLTPHDVFPEAMARLEQRAEDFDDLLQMVSELAFDLDFSRLDALQHWLRSRGVHGHSAQQVQAFSMCEVLP